MKLLKIIRELWPLYVAYVKAAHRLHMHTYRMKEAEKAEAKRLAARAKAMREAGYDGF